MPIEIPFQIAALLSVVAFLGMRAYYRHKSGTLQFDLSGGRDSKQLKLFVFVLCIIILGLLLWLINPAWLRWSAIPLPEWVRWGGFTLAFAGLALLGWSHQTLSESFSGNLEIRDRHKLVTNGPYQWIRHPIYSAIILWAIGLSLITASWFIVLIPLAFIQFFLLRVPMEENMMKDSFGNKYRDYMKRTGRFLPHFAPRK